MIKWILTITLMTLTPLSAENNSTSFADVKKSIYDALSSINSYTTSERKKTLNSMHSLLDEIDREIGQMQSSLKNESSNLSDSSKEQWKKSLADLQKQREKLSLWYAQLKESSASGWEKYKESFSNAYDDFNRSYHQEKELQKKQETSNKTLYI